MGVGVGNTPLGAVSLLGVVQEEKASSVMTVTGSRVEDGGVVDDPTAQQ